LTIKEKLEKKHSMTLEELEKYVDCKIKELHKNCLTDQFDNGGFWAYKDIQQKLRFLKQPVSE
jgi:hypothetical protein